MTMTNTRCHCLDCVPCPTVGFHPIYDPMNGTRLIWKCAGCGDFLGFIT